MAKSEKQKLKTLYVAEYLKRFTDEDHTVIVEEIEDYLSGECGIEAERRSIQRDIKILRDEFGMDIECKKGSKYYRLKSRQFDFDDLCLLAECAYSAKFISKDKAKQLVSSLGQFGSDYQAEQLEEEVFLCDRVKTTQTDAMKTVRKIKAAMAVKVDGKPHTPQKISFQYLRHTIDNINATVERRGGKEYVVSPYKLLINEGNYYLLAFSDRYQEIRTYRVDRMKNVKLLPEGREGAGAYSEIDIEAYTRNVFSMFSGEKQRVQLRFSLNLLDVVIERFGTGSDTTYFPDGKEHFINSAACIGQRSVLLLDLRIQRICCHSAAEVRCRKYEAIPD